MAEANQLGALLLERNLLNREQLDAALDEQTRTRKSLGRVLIEQGVVGEDDLVSTLAAQIGLEFVELDDESIDPTAVATVSAALARRYQALPIRWEDGRLVVAMADPSNVFALDDIRTITGAEVRTVVATRTAIVEAIDRHHRLDGDVEDISAQASADATDEDDLSRVKEVVEDAPIVKLVNLLITQAVQERASDIHIEPTERDVRIRYRIDGVLHEKMRSPKNIQSGLISRLKIMADINIAERRIPQDGRVSLRLAEKQIDLRVATLPTVYGEKVVMRILDKSTALLKLSDLGFLDANYTRFEQSFRKPYGMILVTGPTGSGKSTTLYATLNIVNDAARNIITVEDPVEYRLPGVNQCQVNVKAGMTFAAALRSILRSDPDIVLVGEIRDRETATIAIEAALTGHLVLSTLHTNDAATTPTRLVEMGVEPFLVSSALDCVVAQRLARKLCDRCKEPYLPSEAELVGAGWEDALEAGGGEVFRPVGCQHCGKTGYHGRFAIHEVMNVTEDVERLIVERGHSEDIKKVAVAQGMLTLRQAGLAQVRNGLTSIEEILRVVA
ncbi:MAG TPA: ATPase, T2SS/T4P/T4SS family [Acidimicrobiales bacterium]|jgi:type IV pilus assembly protein PilB|nr:ATPase, T2SS/T4P/T4SS family [Acidimicrobiales bacterium]